MNDLPAHLVVKLGPNPEKDYSLSQPETTIGRSPGNTITIAIPEISRRHARIRREGANYSVEDWAAQMARLFPGKG